MSDPPGAKALQVMKRMEKAIVQFKKPAVPKKKQKPKILNEEEYIEELSKIIQRDFFPDLEKLRAQNEYLDALERNDIKRLREIYAKYSGKTPTDSRAMSPATFETPIISSTGTPRCKETNVEAEEAAKSAMIINVTEDKEKSVSDGHNLDSFLNIYTSEDNYSFQEIIETADQKLRQKFSVLYNEEKLSAEKLARALTLPGIEKQFDEVDPMRKIETWSYKNKNYIMYIPDGVDLTKEEKIDMVNRRQGISYSNTRLTTNPFNESQNKEAMSEIAKSQAKVVSGKIGVDGNVVENGMPKIRGFELVVTPSPRPGEDYSPLMTWGEIEGTPFRLDGGDTPVRPMAGPSFHINENSRREAIGLELAEKVGERMRAQKQKAMDTARRNISSPFMKSTMERLASMSPAARRLASTKLGLRTSSMTPSPICTPSSSKRTVKRSPAPIVRRKTPAIETPNKPTGTSDLTDDLLKIPTKRFKASDFF